MNIIKIILAVSILALSGYSLLDQSVNLTSITLFLMGTLLLTMGAGEIKKENKSLGYLLIIIGLFNFFVSVQDLILV